MRYSAISALALVLAMLASTSAAAQSSCGYVSSAKVPPESKGYYPAQIRKIDGKEVSRGPARYRLGVGVHLIEVEERIAESRKGRAKLGVLGGNQARQVTKTLEIMVKADGSYHIGAKLLEVQKDVKQPSDYWEPGVWRTLVENCG